MNNIERKDYRLALHGRMKKTYRKRIMIDRLATIFAIVCVVAAIIPLGSIVLEVVKNGVAALSVECLIATQGSIGSGKGGIGPAIQGTIIVVGLASLIATPVGVLAGIYLSEFAGNGIFPTVVRFLNNILTGLPSIVIGIVGYVTVVLVLGSFSVWAGD